MADNIYAYFASLVLGTCAGSSAGYSLIRQVSTQTMSSSRYLLALTFIRLAGMGAIAWYLLQWGTIPFILFGGSMMISKWIAILCLTE